jgi:hypothetical protein
MSTIAMIGTGLNAITTANARICPMASPTPATVGAPRASPYHPLGVIPPRASR